MCRVCLSAATQRLERCIKARQVPREGREGFEQLIAIVLAYRKPFQMQVGSINTGPHNIGLRLKTILDEYGDEGKSGQLSESLTH